MSKEKFVISRKHIPTKLPLYPSLVTGLMLDYYNAPDWLWGTLGTLFLLIWIGCIVAMVQEKEVDTMPYVKEGDVRIETKASWQSRLDKMQERQKNKQ